jgi:hypothetical protein
MLRHRCRRPAGPRCPRKTVDRAKTDRKSKPAKQAMMYHRSRLPRALLRERDQISLPTADLRRAPLAAGDPRRRERQKLLNASAGFSLASWPTVSLPCALELEPP